MLSRRALRDNKAARFRRFRCEQAPSDGHLARLHRRTHTPRPQTRGRGRGRGKGRPSRAGGLEAVGGRGRHRRARVDFAPVVERRSDRILPVLRLPPARTESGSRLCVEGPATPLRHQQLARAWAAMLPRRLLPGRPALAAKAQHRVLPGPERGEREIDPLSLHHLHLHTPVLSSSRPSTRTTQTPSLTAQASSTRGPVRR